MIRSAAALLAVLFTLAPARADKDPRLDEYTSDAGGYRVKLPGRPRVDTKDLDTGTGGKPVPVVTARVEMNSAVYAVSHAVYPEPFRDVPAKTILDGVRNGLKGADGKVDEEKEIALGSGEKVPGWEVLIRAGRNYVRARVYLAGNRLYQVMVTGSKDAVLSETADDFLHSFELLK